MTTQFILSTHENGRWRAFPPDMQQFWQQHGALIGRLLHLKIPLTFAALLDKCQAHAPCPEQNQDYLAWMLVHLLRDGLVTAVPPRPVLPDTLDWDAVLPQAADATGGPR